jgi:hypothetical protein
MKALLVILIFFAWRSPLRHAGTFRFGVIIFPALIALAVDLVRLDRIEGAIR